MLIKQLMILAVALSFATSVNATPRGKNKSPSINTNKVQLDKLGKQYASLIVKGKTIAHFSTKQPVLTKASLSSRSSTSAPKNRNKSYSKSLRVTATAYTSHVNQTDSTPNIAAWGDRLYPGMKSIAVSRDLLKVYGLKHGQKVRIKGLKGEYKVLDKMNKRWKKKIDIYMGMNKRKAFKWGRRKVDILWN